MDGKLCLKTNSHCTSCDMGSIIKDFVQPLIQLLTVDVISYNMENSTTKCLNTAVMLMFFMMGEEKGIEVADACDCTTYNNKSRHLLAQYADKRLFKQNHIVVEKLQKDVLDKKNIVPGQRLLYYVLLTDSYFEPPPGKSRAFFPGHVFIIEKFIDSKSKNRKKNSTVSYNLYQSYINEYDLRKYHEYNGNSFKVSYRKMSSLMKGLSVIMTAEVWSHEVVKQWKTLTKIDSVDLVNSTCGNKFFICYQKKDALYCIENILAYSKKKLVELEYKDPSQPYGEPNMNWDPHYLNNGQMKEQLTLLVKKIEANV